jgi:8-oxo-dGTP pyrophosphatase MutT (NUDIX family)
VKRVEPALSAVQLDAPWLAALRQRAALPPAAPRDALTSAVPRARIGSIEAPLASRLARAGLLRQRGTDWEIAPPLDEGLAAIAEWLHRHALGGRWRAERLAVTDDALRPIATVERAAVRALGIATLAVHLVGVRDDGNVWVQQRALDKATDPGLWDTTMGGQVAAGETDAQTLERETWEEAGWRISQLQGVREAERLEVRRPVVEGYMVEQIVVYDARVPHGAVPANQDGEVQQFACVSPADLAGRLRAGRFTLEAALILASWLQRRGAA